MDGLIGEGSLVPLRASSLPESLTKLRALLDEAAVKRTLIPLPEPAEQPEQMAVALALPLRVVARSVLARADGDLLVLIAPGDRKIDLRRVAPLVGAQRVTLVGAERGRQHEAAGPALVTGLPTLIDSALLVLEYVYGPSGDPHYVLRLTPKALRKAAHAICGEITRSATLQAAGERKAD